MLYSPISSLVIQRGLRGKHNILQPFALVVEDNIRDLLILTRNRIPIQHLHLHRLPVSVQIARDLKFFFLGSEALDDFVGSSSLGLGLIQGAFLGCASRRQRPQQHGAQKQRR
jgi:hypothetical protein